MVAGTVLCEIFVPSKTDLFRDTRSARVLHLVAALDWDKAETATHVRHQLGSPLYDALLRTHLLRLHPSCHPKSTVQKLEATETM